MLATRRPRWRPHKASRRVFRGTTKNGVIVMAFVLEAAKSASCTVASLPRFHYHDQITISRGGRFSTRWCFIRRHIANFPPHAMD
jgi:hypothetical protein